MTEKIMQPEPRNNFVYGGGVKALAAAVILCACVFEIERTAGGEDFPNTVTTLGKVAAGGISSHTEWDQFQDIPKAPDVRSPVDSLVAASLAKLPGTAADTAADYRDTVRGLLGILRIRHMRVDPGPDSLLATRSDNRAAEYEFLRLFNQDTLDWVRVLDADGDGLLWSDGDSGRVELRARYRAPAWKPQVESLSLSLLLNLYARGDSSVPLQYQESRRHWDGTTAAFAAKGARPDSLLRPGDTALVTFEKFLPAGADLADSRARFLVRLGAAPWRFSDNALLRFDLLRHWRIGVIRMLTFAFVPDSAVPAGRLDLTGSFSLSASYDDGGIGDASGTFDGADIRAILDELRAGARKSFRLRYDATGRLLERDSLPLP
jgi:hypothetical protein